MLVGVNHPKLTNGFGELEVFAIPILSRMKCQTR